MNYSTLLKTLKKNIDVGNDAPGFNLIKNYTADSAELSGTNLTIYNDAVNSLENSFISVLQSVFTTDDSSNHNVKEIFTKAQIDAAKYALRIGANVRETLNNYSKLYGSKPSGGSIFTSDNLNILDSIDPADISSFLAAPRKSDNGITADSFDGQSLDLRDNLFFSVIYNLGASRQDAFAELFYPTITISPEMIGLDASITYPSLYGEITRDKNGNIVDGFHNRKPLVKEIYNNHIFATNANKLTPVFRNENKHLLVEELKFNDDSNRQDITTAPIKFGSQVDLLGISQTDAMLAKGTMDNTDSLDRAIRLHKVFFKLTKDTNTSFYAYSMNNLISAKFNSMSEGHNKNLVMNLDTNLTFKIGSTVAVSPVTDEISKGLVDYNNYTVDIRLVVTGQANIAFGTVEVFASNATITAFRDPAGVVLEATGANSAAYTAIKEVFDSMEFVGYTLEAYRTNSNIRTRGRLVTIDKQTRTFIPPIREGITGVVPVDGVNPADTDNDGEGIANQILLTGIITSAHAVTKLVDTASYLKEYSTNSGSSVTGATLENMGLANFLMDPYYKEREIDLLAAVNNLEAHNKDLDIKSTLVSIIRTDVIQMYTDSKYGNAYDAHYGNNKTQNVGVCIGTDMNIGKLFGKVEDIDLGSKFDVYVETTRNELIRGKIFVTFGIFDETRNSSYHPLNSGYNIWAPVVDYSLGTVTRNGAVVKEFHTNPRFAHIHNTPIMLVYNVTNIMEAFHKLGIKIDK